MTAKTTLSSQRKDPDTWRSPTAQQAEAILALRVSEGIDEARPPLFASPLEVLVGSPARRSRLSGVRTRVWSTPVPDEAVLNVQDGLFCSSAELCFLQHATRLHPIMLALLGCELAGSYTPRAASPYGVAERNPLMSIRSVEHLLERCGRMRGVARAREALGYVLPGAASPMESRIALFFTLPRRYGGKQLPRPELNRRFDVSGTARSTTGKRFFRGDLCWKEAGVAVEYDSDAAHTGSDRIAADTKRRNSLACMGITVIGVTRQQAGDFDELNRVALIVGKLLGIDLRERRADQEERCQKLHRLLFRGMRSKAVANGWVDEPPVIH